MEYKYDEESVNALMKWAENAQLPKELQLSEAENIVNLRQYVVANINDIKAHYPDEFYNPAITRLYRLKEKWKERGKTKKDSGRSKKPALTNEKRSFTSS